MFDPPHLTHVGKNSWLVKKYGKLEDGWKDDIKKGFSECMRVLDDHGTLIFKWSTTDVAVNDIIKCVGQNPLFGHKTAKNTIWLTFFKVPEAE